MKLENRFTVPVPVDEAWKVLLDVERVAPCMPGATLTKVDGDDFEGTVKVKVGPVNLTYGGKASFVSKDDATHTAVIDGSGKETRGTGTAKLVDQFAACLSDRIAAGTPEPVFASVAADLGAPQGVPAPPPAPAPPAEAIDLLGTAGAPVLKRLAPALAALGVLVLLVRRLRR